jgi:polysaccharide biosynthesis/export protein
MMAIRIEFALWALLAAPLAAQSPPREPLRTAYVLGPEDQITIHALDADEISGKPVRIDQGGYIRLPLIGRIKAADLTLEQLENEIAARLKPYVKQPEVAVTVGEFRSQPVSVIGSVRTPGVLQLQGQKTLVEILSLAGGLADDAGHSVKISRRLEHGRIPLAGATDDETGAFSVAQVSLPSIMEARSPAENIQIRAGDVVSVPRGEMIYVIGQVTRVGAYMLRDRETLSALQALSLAGGLDRAARPQNARIMRLEPGAAKRVEIPVDLRRVIAGGAPDVALHPDDILFIPASAPKKALARAAEAAVQVATGIAIFRR